MHRSILLLAALATSAALSSPTAQAQPRARVQAHVQDRYCLQGRIWGYPGNCQFSSYQQCLASASGTNAGCGLNPTYAFAPQRGYRY